jgi:hypothetical protein
MIFEIISQVQQQRSPITTINGSSVCKIEVLSPECAVYSWSLICRYAGKWFAGRINTLQTFQPISLP